MDIVSIIKRYGKTSKEVADALNTSPGYISQLGSGKTAPSIKKLDELAAVIGCHRWEFFLDEMDRQSVATAFGLVEPSAQPAPADTKQPAPDDDYDYVPFATATEQQAGQQQGEQQQESVPGVVVCPHCKGRFVAEITFRATE